MNQRGPRFFPLTTTTSFYSPACYPASIVGGRMLKPDSVSVDLPIVRTLHRQTPHTSKRSGLGVEPFKNNGLCSDWSELFSTPASVAWPHAAQHAQQQEKLTNSEDISNSIGRMTNKYNPYCKVKVHFIFGCQYSLKLGTRGWSLWVNGQITATFYNASRCKWSACSYPYYTT